MCQLHVANDVLREKFGDMYQATQLKNIVYIVEGLKIKVIGKDQF